MKIVRKVLVIVIVGLSFSYLPSLYATTQNTFNLTGSFYYLHQDGSWRPVKYAYLEVWEYNTPSPRLLTTTYLGNTQYYNITVNTTHSPSLVRVFVNATDNESVSVGSTMSDLGSIYYSPTPLASVSGSSYHFGPYSVANPEAFHIYDLIANKAWNYLMTVGFNYNYRLFVSWNTTDSAWPIYDGAIEGIRLNRVNQWEDAIILHEFSHSVEKNVYPNWSMPPNCIGNWNNIGTDQCAWSEGWPTFLQAAIRNQGWYGGQIDPNTTTGRNLERPNAQGSASPGAAAGFLWDIFDPINETCDSMENGINGQVNNGIWKVFFNARPTTILQFRSNWVGFGNGYNTQVNKLSDHHRITSFNAPCDNIYYDTYIPAVVR